MFSSMMILNAGVPRKPPKVGEVVSCDNIELDSLENSEGSCDEQVEKNNSSDHEVINIEPVLPKSLNLNGACQDEVSEEEAFLENRDVSLNDLQVLSLRNNNLQNVPSSVLKLNTLVCLDLSCNNLLTIPPEIGLLQNLRELLLDQNVLSVLPGALWDLVQLKTLKLSQNRLTLTPDKFVNMRALVLADNNENNDGGGETKTTTLTNLNLRANRLKGNVILGNYTNLIDLDVSENSIENLDLTSVELLQVLHCSRNILTHITLYGKHLTTLIAGNNRLKTLTVNHLPQGLRHVDVSYNAMEALPDWISGCTELRTLFASNNNLKYLPDHLFCNDMPFLQTVQLAYNQLQQLPSIQRRLPIKEFFLQNNSLSSLPENFFKYVSCVKVLNLSNNRLCEIPKPEKILPLEKLFLTANCLTDKSLERACQCLRNLKVLHAAYNNFTYLPEVCTNYWTEIEEVVLSGNKLVKLPDDVGSLRHLGVLRVHSNLLQNIPQLSNLHSLRVLDLAHNQLDRIDLTALIPPNLKFLDLSCNAKLHVDSKQFNTYRTQRPMSLVDVSGKNRTSLPLTPSPFCENDLTENSWNVGFSETSGYKQRLYVSQIRLPAFCNTEGLFGMFDGESNNDVPFAVDKVVPRILLEERTVKETASEYMKYTMLSSHRELKERGQKQGLSSIIVHIMKSKLPADYSFGGGVKKYVMKVASIGDMRIVLGRAAGPVRLLPAKQRKQIRTNPQLHLMVQDPDVTEVFLDEQDEYMIIANKNLWSVMTLETAIKEVSLQRNVILAAKRLQDLAQSYGAEENLSIIVVKFNLIGSDVDLLMRELRQTIRKNKYQSESGNSTTTCQPGCCCESLASECVNCIDKIEIPPPMTVNHDDRSSPSGQSEHACSDCNSSAKLFVSQLNKQNDRRSMRRSNTPSLFESPEIKTSPERRSYRGVAKALRLKKDEDKTREDTDSGLSEEQFKCWEYMLEQNTQLLFDKELNTLSRGRRAFPKNLPLSRSSPHLSEATNALVPSFLSKQFGSARSFNPLLNRSSSRFALDKKLVGGPHAAYFGSLQRLMPYNLEYDFAVMHERGLADSLDLDRMQQYWGVTTTEL